MSKSVGFRAIAFVALVVAFYVGLSGLRIFSINLWWVLSSILCVAAWLSLLASYYNPWVHSQLWKLRFRVSIVPVPPQQSDQSTEKKSQETGEVPCNKMQGAESELKTQPILPGSSILAGQARLHDHVGPALEAGFALLAFSIAILFAYFVFPRAGEVLLFGGWATGVFAVFLSVGTLAVFNVCQNSPAEISEEISRDPSIETKSLPADEIKKVQWLYYPYFVFCLAVSWCLILLVMFLVGEAIVDYQTLSLYASQINHARSELNESLGTLAIDAETQPPTLGLAPLVNAAAELQLAFGSFRYQMLTSSNRYLGGLTCIMLLVLWALGTRYRHLYTEFVRDVVRLVAAACVFIVLPLVVVGSYAIVVQQGNLIRQSYSQVNQGLAEKMIEVNFEGEDLDHYQEIADRTSDFASVNGYYSGMVSSWGGLAVILYFVVSTIGLKRADQRLWVILRPRTIPLLVNSCNWIGALFYVPKDDACLPLKTKTN